MSFLDSLSGIFERVISYVDRLKRTDDQSWQQVLTDKLTDLEKALESHLEQNVKQGSKLKFQRSKRLTPSFNDLIERVTAMTVSSYDELAEICSTKMKRIVDVLDDMANSREINFDTRNQLVDSLESLTNGKNKNFNYDEIVKLAKKIRFNFSDTLGVKI